jgi:AcrR family transcriptional regulator
VDHPWEHLLPVPDTAKASRFHRVAWSVAVSLLRGGPDQLRIAEVARRADVSRAWVYKYLGRDKESLLAFTVNLYARAFGEPLAGDLETLERLRAGTRKGLDDSLLAPWCVLVYVRWRHARGPLGDAIRSAMSAQASELSQRLPGPLRGDRSLALLFESARLGLYHEWLDPEVRAALDPDRAVDGLLAILQLPPKR